MNAFENLLQQMRDMAAAARASYDERRGRTSSASTPIALDEHGNSAASVIRRARAGSDEYLGLEMLVSPPLSPLRADDGDEGGRRRGQLLLVPIRQDFTLQLDSLTLERVLFYAGAVHCRAVCRRWASMPIRACVRVRSDQRDRLFLLDQSNAASSMLIPMLRRIDVRRAAWPIDALDPLLISAPRLERLVLVARHSQLVARGVGGALVARLAGALHNLRTLTIDCIDADLAAEPISLAVVAQGCARTLRKLALRHVRLADVGALAEFSLELLDLKQVHDIDALLAGPLAEPLAEIAAPLLRALTLDYRPVRGAACIGDTLALVCPRFEQLRVLSVMFHRLGERGLETIGTLRTLDALYLSGCTFGSHGLVGLLPLAARLRELELFCCSVDNVERDLLVVARLTQLRSLMLFDGVAATDVHLLEPLELLEDLYSDSVALTQEATDALAALPALRYVHVASFDERGLARALSGPLRHLRALDFSYEQNALAMDDAHVARLCHALPDLFFIDLDGATRLSSSALVPLARLEHLRHVNLRDADNVSHFAFDRFARFLEQREGDSGDDDVAAFADTHSASSSNNEHPVTTAIGSPQLGPNSTQRTIAAAAAAAAAAATSAGASPAAAAAAAAAAMAAVVASQMPPPGIPPPATRLCTRNFPVDSWSSCVRLAKRHFARDADQQRRRRLLFAERTALVQEELELIAAGGAVLAPMLGERSIEALRALARAFSQEQQQQQQQPPPQT